MEDIHIVGNNFAVNNIPLDSGRSNKDTAVADSLRSNRLVGIAGHIVGKDFRTWRSYRTPAASCCSVLGQRNHCNKPQQQQERCYHTLGQHCCYPWGR